VNDITLRAPGTDLDALPLAAGMLGIGRATDGGLRILEDPSAARVCFCQDRRGVWLAVAEGVRGVHVNGRPVQRKAMLRSGDSVHVDGTEITLVKSYGAERAVAAHAAPTMGVAEAGAEADPRILLRGVTGPHHGRSHTLDRPRLVGSGADADIRIEGPAIAARLAQVGMEGGQAVLRVLARDAAILVNGEPRQTAVLQPGDQLAFDADHRFVLEAPTPLLGATVGDALTPELPAPAPPAVDVPRLRFPWLLLAALLIAGALTALLLL
jgi:pSer/pThr/pTyr-binding forkhead associated (FHA) protein